MLRGVSDGGGAAVGGGGRGGFPGRGGLIPHPFGTDISQSKTHLSQSGITPLQHRLFTSDSQWQSRGRCTSQGGVHALSLPLPFPPCKITRCVSLGRRVRVCTHPSLTWTPLHIYGASRYITACLTGRGVRAGGFGGRGGGGRGRPHRIRITETPLPV
jgi:hypothetical protein